MPTGTCKLCNKESDLSGSHIIPRSYYKYIKGNSSQVIEVIEGNESPLLTNGDKKEYLLCASCENLLNTNYEQYGTRILKNTKKIVKITDDRLHFEYDYKKLYLYFASILWRVSVSQKFKNIGLATLNKFLADCIYENTLKIKNPECRIDDLLKIHLIKIRDESKTLSDDMLRRILSNFKVERMERQETSLSIFWIVGGFKVCYQISGKHELYEVTGILSKEGKMLIPIEDISSFRSTIDLVNLINEFKNRPHK